MNKQIYKKNLEALFSYHNSEYLNYAESVKNKSAANKYGFIKTEEELLVPYNENTNTSYYSVINTFQHLKESIENNGLLDFSEYIFFGFCAGYHIKLLSKSRISAKFIVFENNIELFDAILKNIDVSELFALPNLMFFFNLPNDLEEILKRIELAAGRIFLLDNPALLTLDNDIDYSVLYNLFSGKTILPRKKYNLHTQIQKNIATLNLFADDWTKNILANVEAYLKTPSFNKLYGLFCDRPVVLVAAGPSLDINVKHLKNLKNQALMICVDTAVKTLLENNIDPDIIVSIDISEHNLKYLSDIETQAVLICELAMPAKITNNFDGRLIFTHYGHSLAEFLDSFKYENADRIASIGTVSAAAFDVANKLGCNPFIFIGFDFAYTKNRIHCAKADFDAGANHTNKFITPETIFYSAISDDNDYNENLKIENGLVTDLKFLNWREWFEDSIKILSGQDNARFFNATADGLEITGAKRIKATEIKEYINKPLKIQVFDYCAHLKKNITNQTAFDEKIYTAFKNSLNLKINAVKPLIEHIEKYINRIEMRPDNKNNERFYTELLILFNKFYAAEISCVFRWSLYIDEMKFRRLTNDYTQENINVLKILVKSYQSIKFNKNVCVEINY